MKKTLPVLILLLLSKLASLAQAPFVGSFSPQNGNVGERIQINGFFFGNSASENSVYFGSVKATIISATDKSIEVTAPVGSQYAPLKVLNHTTKLSGSSALPFNLIFPSKNGISASDFDARVDFANTNGPKSTIFTDLDGDGKLDLTTLNNTTNTITIYRNTSTIRDISANSFGQGIELATGGGPKSVLSEDIDGDGKFDLVTLNLTDHTLSIFRNTSTSGTLNSSSFATKVDIAIDNTASSVVCADIDDDGKIDILTINGTSISILKNNTSVGLIGASSFQVRQNVSSPGSITGLVVADFNNDYSKDLIAFMQSSTYVFVIENKNSGYGEKPMEFKPYVGFNAGALNGLSAIAAADIDGDSKMDIVSVSYSANKAYVLKNITPSGTGQAIKFASAPSEYATGKGPIAVAVADVDGNGAVDIVTANSSDNSLTVLRNLTSNGTIAFGGKVDVATKTFPTSVALADVDGDGKPDLVSASYVYNSFSIHRYNPANPPAITSFSPISGPPGTLVTLVGKNFHPTVNKNVVFFGGIKADIISAAEDKLVVRVPKNALRELITVLNTETLRQGKSTSDFLPTFPSKNSIIAMDFSDEYPGGNGQSTGYVTMGDLDLDGKPEVVFNNQAANNIRISVTNSNLPGATYGFVQSEITLTTGKQPTEVKLEDLDGDGLLDIIVPNVGDESISIFKNISTLGQVAFAGAITLTGATNANFKSIEIADFNKDGKPDLILGGSTLQIFKNTSTKEKIVFAGEQNLSIYDIRAFNVLDVNSDGRPDIVYSLDGRLKILENSSQDSNITFLSSVEVGPGGDQFEVADMNNDGKEDLVIGSQRTFTVYWNKYTGAGPIVGSSLISGGVLSTDIGYYRFKLGDMDGDGKVDIAATCAGYNGISIYRNISDGDQAKFEFRVDMATRYEVNDIFLGDINGDMTPDVLVGERVMFLYYNQPKDRSLLLPPKITSFTPQAAIGENIDVIGSGFSPSVQGNQVFFGTVQGTVIAASETKLTVKVPNTAPYAKIIVLKTDNKLSAMSSTAFSLTYPSKKQFTERDFSAPVEIEQLTGEYTYLADMNGDSKLDLVTRSSFDLFIRANQSATGKLDNTSFGTVFKWPIVMDEPVALGDLNNDGLPDIIYGNNIRVSKNSSSQSGLRFDNNSFYSSTTRGFVLRDMDGDGKTDIIAGNASYDGLGKVVILHNESKSSYPFFAYGPAYIANPSIKTPMVEDIDGDGKAEVIVQNQDLNVMEFYANNFVQHYVTPTSLGGKTAINIPKYVAQIYFVDLNNDAKLDMVVGDNTNTLNFYQNTSTPGNISFATAVTMKLEGQFDEISWGDLDGDGFPDMAIVVDGTKVQLYRHKGVQGNIGTDLFSASFSVKPAAYLRSVKIGDLDGDGRSDLFIGTFYKSFVMRNNPIDYPVISSDTKQLECTVPVKIHPNFTLTYLTAKINSAKISIVGNLKPSQDRLVFVPDPSVAGDISASYDTATGIMTLSSVAANNAQWEQAIRSITYQNLRLAKETALKEIKLEVANGATVSNAIMANIKVINAPSISWIDKMSATTGDKINIYGEDFDNTSEVKFGGVAAASFKIISPTYIESYLGAGSTGNVTVTNPIGTGTLSGFTYLPRPTLSAATSTTIFTGESVVLTASTGTGYNYQWYRDGYLISVATGPTFTATTSGIYKVNIVKGNDIVSSNEIKVTVLSAIPATNFKVSATSVSCKGSDNGTINITSILDATFVATLTKGSVAVTTVNFNKTLTLDKLSAGSYRLCITVQNAGSLASCFDLVISEPKDLSLYASVNQDKQNVLLSLGGGTTYHIEVNKNTYTTSANEITVPLLPGSNLIKVSTDVRCQGILEKTVVLNKDLVAYPNPFERTVSFNLMNDPSPMAKVEITDLNGRTVLGRNYPNKGVIEIDLSALSSGIYVLKVVTEKNTSISKIIKK